MASVLTVGSLALCGSMAGCYEHHTADEELLDIPFPDEAYGDAGVTAPDAGSRCTGTDPIALFICNLTQPAATGTGTAAQPSLTDLLSGAGTLATLLGGGTGTGGTGTGTGTGAAADPLAALLAAFTGGGTGTGTSTPSLADLLAGIGIAPTTNVGTTPPRTRDAGVGRPSVTMPTAAQCKEPADQITQFLCMLQGQGAAVDAGTVVIPMVQ